MQLHKLHSNRKACIQLHELACSYMSLNAVPFFVWAAHKNFAVLVLNGWVKGVILSNFYFLDIFRCNCIFRFNGVLTFWPEVMSPPNPKINYCQATGTGTGTGNWESRIETVPVLTVKCPGPPTTTTHPQLLTMMECSDKKVPLVRMS